ncbi:uncharacterized protein K02A2.6-like [Anastrepha obliqua]|uniref:uncharacterized protein K02A2.6-like n=1 Tax=Anastrepha obliqua TaxID=95512 RepID=UPI00240A211C|nr:uncharacterized protein K02A2.6-like [Anastrepha obliqua]
MFSLGKPRSNSVYSSRVYFENSSCTTSWHRQNEDRCSKLCVVAEHRCGNRTRCEEMQFMSAKSQRSTPNNNAPLGICKTSMVPPACGFRRSFSGKLFFILIDSYSKWLEVTVVNSTSSAAAIKVLRQIFATHGLPDELVSDNGTAFTSEEFKNFMKNNLIRHIRSAPFHPSTNGQAERMVQSTKNYLKKAEPGINIDLSLARYLFNQHTTPHSTTNRSPAELLFNRELKTYFDKIQPHEIVYGKVTDPVSTKPFISGSPIWVRNHSTGPRWIEGLVENQTGPISYEVRLNDSRVIKRHQDQLRSRVASEDSDCEILSTEDVEASTIQSSDEVDSSTSGHVVETQSPGPSTNLQPVASSSPTPEEPRRSKRDRQAPQFYSASGC